jgi:hypothetical protein
MTASKKNKTTQKITLTISRSAPGAIRLNQKHELPFALDEEGYAVYRLERDSVLAQAFYLDCGGNLSEIDETIFAIPDDKPVKQWMLQLRQEARECWMKGSDGCELSFAKLTILNERMLAIRRELKLLPFAKKGIKFKPGRPEGSHNPFNQAIKNALLDDRAAKARQIWDWLRYSPPKGYEYHDSAGGYFDTDADGEFKTIDRTLFSKSVSRIRKQLKNS